LLPCILFFSLIASRKNTALQTAQAELDRAKDSQLASDLKDKDLQIAETKNEGKRIEIDAKNRAAEIEANANKKIAETKAEADVKIAEAAKDANTANAQAQKALLAQEQLREQNLATEARLESERNTRLELEESLEPRVLESHELVEARFRKLAGASFMIQCSPDFEPRRLAGQIRSVLKVAGWNDIGTAWVDEVDGVRVEAMENTDKGNLAAATAGSELVSYLNANGVDADPSGRLRIAEYDLNKPTILNTDIKIKIRIGQKPNEYFTGKITEVFLGKGETADWQREQSKKYRLQKKAKRDELRKEWKLTLPWP